uniref:Apolipoprotein M n=1 Tax=Sphaeramia orbicularis TaxID=375764 RepID=A0A673CZW0_9TELE
MFATCALVLLCLIPLSCSAPLTCEDLVRPLDHLDPHHLEGRWALVAGGLSDPGLQEFFKRRNSSSINFSSAHAASSFSYTPSVDAGGKCHYKSYNISLEGSVLTFDVLDQVNLTVTFLFTSCPDCLVMRYDNISGKTERVFLFSRRRKVDLDEMEEFRAQAECLKMLPPAVMDHTKELCPEQNSDNHRLLTKTQ